MSFQYRLNTLYIKENIANINAQCLTSSMALKCEAWPHKGVWSLHRYFPSLRVVLPWHTRHQFHKSVAKMATVAESVPVPKKSKEDFTFDKIIGEGSYSTVCWPQYLMFLLCVCGFIYIIYVRVCCLATSSRSFGSYFKLIQ